MVPRAVHDVDVRVKPLAVPPKHCVGGAYVGLRKSVRRAARIHGIEQNHAALRPERGELGPQGLRHV